MPVFADKSIKDWDLGFQKVKNSHGWNVELENPPTHKRRDDASCGNFGMDATAKTDQFRKINFNVKCSLWNQVN